MVLRLGRGITSKIESLSREACPKEAVGFLAGKADGTVSCILPLTNIATLGRFLAHPYEQFQTERAIKEAGLQILAIFHSHPWGGASPSPEDLNFAKAWPCAHAIFAFDPAVDDQWELRAFVARDSSVIEIPIEIE